MNKFTSGWVGAAVWRWHFVCFGYRRLLSAFSIHIKHCSSSESGAAVDSFTLVQIQWKCRRVTALLSDK